MKKSKISTILIIVATVILAGVAIFTAIRLYNLRDQAVAPNAPTSKPAAAPDYIGPPERTSNCTLSFSLTSPTATATSTATATATSTATATATPNPQCDDSCTSNTDCPGEYICYIPSGSVNGNCRNSSCLSESDCSCNATATPTSTATATATTEAELPDAGTSWPTIVGGSLGIFAILGALLLAL